MNTTKKVFLKIYGWWCNLDFQERADIREMVSRLENPERDEADTEATGDAIDFLYYINESYADEIPFLIEKLRQNKEVETLIFIICTLREIPGSLNEEIIRILSDKVDDIISDQIDTDILEYIYCYLLEQGMNFHDTVISLYLKIIKSRKSLIVNFLVFQRLCRWLGFLAAIRAIRK